MAVVVPSRADRGPRFLRPRARGVPAGPPGRLQGAAPVGLRRRAAPHRFGQGPEARRPGPARGSSLDLRPCDRYGRRRFLRDGGLLGRGRVVGGAVGVRGRLPTAARRRRPRPRHRRLRPPPWRSTPARGRPGVVIDGTAGVAVEPELRHGPTALRPTLRRHQPGRGGVLRVARRRPALCRRSPVPTASRRCRGCGGHSYGGYSSGPGPRRRRVPP